MTAGPAGVPRMTAGWTLFVLFLVNALNVGDRTLLGVVTEPVRIELALSDTHMSLANGFLFVLFNLVGGLVIARFVDRGNRKRILALGVAAWSIATAATGLAHDFLGLSFARIGVGIGEATAFPAAMSLIPDLFAPTARGKAVAVFQSSGFIGIVGGTILAGVLAASLGWRGMFQICGAAGLALVVLLVLSVREPRRETAPQGGAVTPWLEDLLVGGRRILAIPGFAALAVAFGISGMMTAVLGAWGPAFLQRSHGVPLAQVGLVIGPAVGIGGIAGTLFSGFAADRLVRRCGNPAAALRVPLVALPLAVPFMAGFVALPTLTQTMASAAAMNFLLSCGFAPCVSYAVTAAAPGDRGLASTVMLAASGVIGSGLGPFIVGVLSDALAANYGAESLRLAMGSLVVTPLLAAALLWLATRRSKLTGDQAHAA
jgi:MFS family permease